MHWTITLRCIAVFIFLSSLTGCNDDTVVITPPQEKETVVVTWNNVLLAAIRNTSGARPPVISRSLFLLHQAMYDAWAVYDDTALPTVLNADMRRPAAERTLANKQAAVSMAAYHIVLNEYPDYERRTQAFSRLLRDLGYTVVNQTDNTPSGMGYAAAKAVLADRLNDGANSANNFAEIVSTAYPTRYVPRNSSDPNATNAVGQPDFDANRWEPLRVPTGVVRDANNIPIIDPNNPASYRTQSFMTPHWGSVRPFALKTGSQFRPNPPPQAGSSALYTDGLGRTMTNDQAYHQQVDEILSIYGNLTERQKIIAEYWEDGIASETPPGHWNWLAHGISVRDKHTLDQDIKLYFALNAALFDASIICWDAKRTYDYIRPISAIRHKYKGKFISTWGGYNQGTRTVLGEQFQPYQAPTFVTPPFSDYTSGHSTFSMAAAEVLTRFTGNTRFYDGKTQLPDDVNKDGIPDLVGEHIATLESSKYEKMPTQIITLRWQTFQEAAEEAGMSRLYGGIHYQDANLIGARMGKQVGEVAYTKAAQYWQGLAR